MSNLWASFQIFISNFRAFYGWYVNLLLVLLALGLACSLFVRAILRGRSRYKTAALTQQLPDPELTGKAAARLAGLLRFPTVTGQSDAMQNQLAYIKTVYAPLLKQLGFLEMDSGSILLRWKSREKSEELPVLFCGHLDVVPPGDGWREGPFSGSRKDGKIYGRGAIDCKGNVIALLEAVESLMEEGYAPKRELYFAFGHDEETGGHEGAAAIADLMRRRGLAFEAILDEGGFIAEDFMDSPCCAAAMIGLGEKPSCNYKIIVTAAGGHSGVVPLHTTLGILAEAVCRIEASQPHLRVLPVAAEYLQKSSPVMSFGKRLVVSNLPLTRPFLKLAFHRDARTLAMLRSTLAPTRITGSTADNVLPAEATVTVNARLLPGERGEDLLAFLKGLLSDLPAEIQLIREDEQVPVSDTDHPMYLLLQRTLEERFPKLPCIPTLIAGGTDSKHYAAMSDCILRFNPFVMTGSNMDTVHGADEYITERTLGLGIELYRSLMKKL